MRQRFKRSFARLRWVLPLTCVLALPVPSAWAQVLDEAEVTNGTLLFGNGIVGLGDLDGDGVPDVAGGAPTGGLFGEGQFSILFLNADGTVKSQASVFGLDLSVPATIMSSFGSALGSPGDLDGDGVPDVLAGARGYFNGTETPGAVWAIFLNADGTVKRDQIISEGVGGFTGSVNNFGDFGSSIDALGDIDGDGVCDIAVGASADPDGGVGTGAVWVLFMNPDGTVKAQRKISETQGGSGGGGFGGDPVLRFGNDVAGIGDVDGNGVPDLAVGEALHPSHGAVWILLLKQNGTVIGWNKVAKGLGGFDGALDDFAEFGYALDGIGDIDGDGSGDLIVGARGNSKAFVLFTEGGLHASSIPYPGSGASSDCFVSRSMPRLGTSWTAQVDATGHAGAAFSLLHGRGQRLDPAVTISAGEILVDIQGSPMILHQVLATSGGVDSFSNAVPNDLALLGFRLSVQGAILGGGAEACRAVDLIIGH